MMRWLGVFLMVMMLVSAPSYAGCSGVTYISERDLDVEADVIFQASNPEGPNAKNPYNRGFGRGPVTFTVDKVFKGNLSERQKVEVEFLSEHAHIETGYLGALYFRTGVVAAKHNGTSLISIGAPEGMCRDIKVNKDVLAEYFANGWNLTRLEAVFVKYGLTLKTAYYHYRYAPIHIIGGVVSFFVMGFAMYFACRRKKASKI